MTQNATAISRVRHSPEPQVADGGRGRARLLTAVAIAVVLIIVASVLLLLNRSSGPTRVTVATAGAASITAAPGGTGVLQAAVDLPIVLGYRGSVTHVDVTLGQKVAPGQPLLGVDSEALTNAVSQLQSHLALDRATLTSLQAHEPLLQPALPADAAKIRAVAGQVALDERLVAAAQARVAEIRAPISGVIGVLAAAPGMVIGSSSPLMDIVDYSQVTVTASIPVAYFGLVALGSPAVLSGVGAPGVQLAGTVTGVGPQTLAGGQDFPVVITANNPRGQGRPGMTADVRISVKVAARVAVNVLAVHNTDTRPTVFVIAGGKVEQRAVVLGTSDEHMVQVLAGLAPGERVAVTGTQVLSDGDAVTVEPTS